MGVQVGQQAGEQGGQGESQYHPPPPGAHHRPAQRQGQRRQGQQKKLPGGLALLQKGEAGVVLERPPPAHPAGKQVGDCAQGEPRALDHALPAQRGNPGQQGGQPAGRQPVEPGQGPGAQRRQGENPRRQEEKTRPGGAEIQRSGRNGLPIAVQRQKRAGQPHEGAGQQRPVPQKGEGGQPLFLVSHRPHPPPGPRGCGRRRRRRAAAAPGGCPALGPSGGQGSPAGP